MPRASCARNGNVTLVNSPSGTSTVDPSGTAAATIATSGDTWLPMATVSGSHVHQPGVRLAGGGHVGVVARRVGGPRRHSSCAAARAARVARGGRPIVAELR